MSPPLGIDELRRRAAAGEAFSIRPFYGYASREDGHPSNAVFSQFFTCRFEIDGLTYLWAEQWMMACKARLFGDRASLEAIMAADSADDCWRLGRGVAGYDDARWNEVRLDLVISGNVAKFGQDEMLRDYLLATGDDVLAEASPTDRLWGIGLSRDDPDAGDPLAWPGLNMLGFALMRVRGILRG